MEYILTFIEGIASFISPCILPMLPIYISYFAGEKDNSDTKKIINAIGFVIGFTFVFVILSIFASSLGQMVARYSSWIKIIFGIVIIILGCNYIGIIKLAFLNKTNKKSFSIQKLNFIKSIAFGMLFSVSWTPCVGAFLSSALLLIAKEQDMIKGVTLIILYSVGLGIPFIISAILLEKMKKTFTWIKNHYNIIIIVSGIILIAMGLYFILV